MTSRWLWAVLIGAGTTFSLLESCGEVQSCKELDQGCLNGAPNDDGTCRAGLVLDATGSTCVRKKSATVSSNDGGGGVVGTTNPCGCKSGQLCRGDGTCSDPCSKPANLPMFSSALPTCRPPPGMAAYDFATAATALCYQACTHRAAYCGGACDPAKECVPGGAAMAAVLLQCPGQSVECAMNACEAARDTKCSDQKCAGMSAPNCAGVVCTNTCANHKFNNDGLCDDGDLSNASSAVCDWGTDCGDCGPRKGSAPPFSVQLGDPCVDPVQCGGDVDDVTMATGWCLLPGSAEPSRCLPDCSLGKKCPAGFTCHDLELTDSGDPVKDPAGRRASACFPTQCGN
ncbi:MAG: hypothetical protein JWN04_5901 [Myxococcaceae bacterium]|nr:hypothetical protein [Myxococcaceae bacterium]